MTGDFKDLNIMEIIINIMVNTIMETCINIVKEEIK
jgi:hypothetical protein